MALSDRRNIEKVKVITFHGYRGRVSRSLSCGGVPVLSGKQCLQFQIRINGWRAVLLKGREEAMLSSLCVLTLCFGFGGVQFTCYGLQSLSAVG